MMSKNLKPTCTQCGKEEDGVDSIEQAGLCKECGKAVAYAEECLAKYEEAIE